MDTVTINRLKGLTSKIGIGIQNKWLIDNTYYKADTNGYEGLAETLASAMMDKSNIGRHFRYRPVILSVNGKTSPGCASENGLEKNEELLTTYNILAKANSEYVKKIENRYDYGPPGEKIQMFLKEMEKYTGLKDFDRYMTKLIEFDAIILNEDRHYNNIAVIRRRTEKGYEYDYGPIFDNGTSFGLYEPTMMLYRSGADAELISSKLKAKTFSDDFAKQAKYIENETGLGPQLQIQFSKEDLDKVLNRCQEAYDYNTLDYTKEMFLYQMDRYRDFFYGKEREIWKENIREEIEQKTGKKIISENSNGKTLLFSAEQPNMKIEITPSGKYGVSGNGDVGLYEISQRYGDGTMRMYMETARTVNAYSNTSFSDPAKTQKIEKQNIKAETVR